MKRLEEDRASISVRDMGNNRTGGSLSTERALHNVRADPRLLDFVNPLRRLTSLEYGLVCYSTKSVDEETPLEYSRAKQIVVVSDRYERNLCQPLVPLSVEKSLASWPGTACYAGVILMSPFFLPSNAEVLGNKHQIGQ
jgi:hypothetical protein